MAAKKKSVSNAVILRTMVSMSENMNERMNDFATKSDLTKLSEKIDKVENKLLQEIRAIGKAVDKDAVTIIDHEKRITRVEKQLSVR